MSCKDSSNTYGPTVVWSSQQTNVWLFHPLSGALPSGGVKKVRVSFEMAQNTGLCKIRPALRMSNDGATWDTPQAIGAATRNSDGITYGAAFEDMSTYTEAKSFVQYGIEVENDSGSVVESCKATLKVDIED